MLLTKEQIEEALRDVLDPQLGINIVDLGLIYEINLDDKNNVNIKMTLTTQGCPLHDSITFGIQNRLKLLEGIGEIDVQLVWEPRWTPSRMSDYARELLWG